MDSWEKGNIVAAAVENINSQLDPVLISKAVKGLDADSIGHAFQAFKGLGQRAWIGMSVCFGEVYASSHKSKSGVIKEISAQFGISWQLGYQLLTIYNEIIKPRLDAQGEDAFFPLQEKDYYQAACEYAAKNSQTALEVIELAEEKKGAYGSYTCKKFREDLNFGESYDRNGPVNVQSPELRRLLRRVQRVSPDYVAGDIRDQDISLTYELLEEARVQLEQIKAAMDRKYFPQEEIQDAETSE